MQHGFQRMIIPEEKIPTKASSPSLHDLFALLLPTVNPKGIKNARTDPKLSEQLMVVDECVVCD